MLRVRSSPTVLPLPRANLAPLLTRLDRFGIVEHARGSVPAPESGHCTDDAGRALGLAVALPRDPDARTVATACLRQLDTALQPDGHFVLRLDQTGRPTASGPSDDATARALWGLARVSSAAPGIADSGTAEHLLAHCAEFESHHPRAAAHAVLAATELLAADPTSALGRRLFDANLPHIPTQATASDWRWPEPRLTYGNGLIVEALLAAASTRESWSALDEALGLLGWLVEIEWNPAGHFSFTPTGGRGPGDPIGFDQQPIEAWTLASACRRAYELTLDPQWRSATVRAAAWFAGLNDHGVLVWDPATGAAFDGLTASAVNENEGTESTLSLIGTLVAYDATGDLARYSARRRVNS